VGHFWDSSGQQVAIREEQMKWVRRIVFSLAALASIFAGVYFSFLVESPNESLTGIWLAFAILMLTLAWPEIVKSVNFMGNSIEFRELESEVKKLSNLMKSYWTELRNEMKRLRRNMDLLLILTRMLPFYPSIRT
jgi:TRAP-type uncharacterized transport system fused permease subunit